MELEGASTVLQRVRKRAAPCIKAMSEPGSSATTAPGSEQPIIEDLQDSWKPLRNFYDAAFINVQHLAAEYKTQHYVEIQQKFLRLLRMTAARPGR